MPELPEVETIVGDLRPLLKWWRFRGISSVHPPIIKGAIGLANRLKGRKVLNVERRGKFINIFFEGDLVMTLHLRMSGRILFCGSGDGQLKFERTRIDFDRGSLRFCDVRKFGRVWISRADEYEAKTGIAKLGIEPLSEKFDCEKFVKILNGRKGMVKKWLLDQRLIAGIGNIYADEACFYAGVRPDRRVEKMSRKELGKLFEGIVKALEQGVRNRGTSISDFADAYGKSGRNQELLYVYGRGGEPCFKCGKILMKAKVAGRGTVFCKNCQK